MKNQEYVYQILILVLSVSCLAGAKEKLDNPVDTTNQTPQDKDAHPTSSNKDSRGLFSPRMDYEQWTPLGRGDPLKNDPTYDYVPPVLERVHYWIDPSSRKPDPPSDTKKTEILVLGVSSKKPSVGYSMADSRRDQYDPYLQFVDGTNYNSYQRPQRPQYGAPYYSSPYYKMNDKEPYTILVPPPMHTIQDSISYQQPMMSSSQTTTPVPSTASISVDEANLVYQSSSVSTADEWKGSNTYATIAEPSSQVTWRTPLPVNKTLSIHQPTSFSIVSSIQPSMSVLMKPSNIKNMETDIIVAPEIGMHKGQVTDDTLDLSSTYVNIGKPDAQVQPATGIEAMGDLSTEPLQPPMKNAPMTFGSSMFMIPTPYKMQNTPPTLQMTMQTMVPTLTTQDMNHKKLHPNFLHSLLRKETTTPSTIFLPTTLPPTTTSISSLTTDPLFKHYKQPVEPLKGPLYLIIQGHSKVKTYGPSKQINGISVQESNEISTSDDRNMDTEYQVKHLHHDMMKDGREEWKREGRSNKLQSLNHVIVTGLGAIDFSKEGQRRNDNIKETELVLKYDVSDSKENSSEIYHKGFVESDLPPNRPTLYSLMFDNKNK